MDAAAAAAMSDPERNRLFRRRWTERAESVPAPVCSIDQVADLELVGRELLAVWRRERATGGERDVSATEA